MRFRVGLFGTYCSSRAFVVDVAVLVEGQVGDLANAGFDDGLTGWTIVGETGGTVAPVDVGGNTAIQMTSVTGQPVGVEQLFDGYDYNAASATVSVASGDEAQVMLEILRLDGTVVDAQSVTVVGGQGWVTIGSGLWSAGAEDVLVYRLTTTGADPVFFDYGIVGLAT